MTLLPTKRRRVPTCLLERIAAAGMGPDCTGSGEKKEEEEEN